MIMSRSYDDTSAERRARMSGAAKRQQATFEHAYDLAMQIVELRERRGLTQEDLAKLTGIDQGDISRIERGSANPTERTLARIADALGARLRLVEGSYA
jgi:ribosome-binding protein aMBF1 (putative translation factor)